MLVGNGDNDIVELVEDSWKGKVLTAIFFFFSLVRQRGRVVGVLDFEFTGPGFESHSEHFMDLFHGSPALLNPSAALVNSQLVCLPAVGILKNMLCFICNICFSCLSSTPVN